MPPINTTSGAEFERRRATVIAAFRAGRTPAVIADELGLSRSAVSGLIRRHMIKEGLITPVKRAKKQVPHRRYIVRKLVSDQDAAPLEVSRPFVVPPPPPPMPRVRGCQWIDGDMCKIELMCGKPLARGPYCAEHAERCYVKAADAAASGQHGSKTKPIFRF